MNINPWLAEKVKEYRDRHSEDEIRLDYRVYNSFIKNTHEQPWDMFLAGKALQEAMSIDPFLRRLTSRMSLPDSVEKGLYMAGIDCVADLLQLSKEELHVVADNYGFDAGCVEDLMRIGRKRFYSCPGRTWKLSSLAALYTEAEKGDAAIEIWTIPSPGAGLAFRFDRPSLCPEWFEEFYRRNGHYDNEETGNVFLQGVSVPNLDGPDAPSDFKEYFQAAKNLWSSYESVCTQEKIRQRIPRPQLPTPDVLSVYRNGWRAVVDVLERTSILDKYSKGKFLSCSDEEKLKIAEDVDGSEQDFQLMLISIAELKIDIENIVIYLEDCLKGRHRYDYKKKPEPMDLGFARAVERFRGLYSDDELKGMYRQALVGNPSISWTEFIVQAAIAEP